MHKDMAKARASPEPPALTTSTFRVPMQHWRGSATTPSSNRRRSLRRLSSFCPRWTSPGPRTSRCTSRHHITPHNVRAEPAQGGRGAQEERRGAGGAGQEGVRPPPIPATHPGAAATERVAEQQHGRQSAQPGQHGGLGGVARGPGARRPHLDAQEGRLLCRGRPSRPGAAPPPHCCRAQLPVLAMCHVSQRPTSVMGAHGLSEHGSLMEE